MGTFSRLMDEMIGKQELLIEKLESVPGCDGYEDVISDLEHKIQTIQTDFSLLLAVMFKMSKFSELIDEMLDKQESLLEEIENIPGYDGHEDAVSDLARKVQTIETDISILLAGMQVRII